MGFVVQAGSAYVHGRGALQEAFFFGVAVVSGHGAESAGHGGPGPAAFFEPASVAFNVGPAGPEEGDGPLLAPGGEPAQVEHVGVSGQTPISGQVPDQGLLLGIREGGVVEDNCGRVEAG